MTRHFQLFIYTASICALSFISTSLALEKWSRQIEHTDPGIADSFDWVPLAKPVDGSTKDRSANARVLTYSQTFPPNGRFGDLPKSHPPLPPQQQLQPAFNTFPYQFQRFSNGPPPPPPPPHLHPQQQQHLLHQQGPHLKSSGLHSQEPTSQSFFKFEMPLHGDNGNRINGGVPSTVQTGYQIQHTFGGGNNAHATIYNSPLFNQPPPVFPQEYHPIPPKPLHQPLQQKPLHHQNFIEDTLPLKNSYKEAKPLPTQQTLQSVTPQVFPLEQEPEQLFDLNKPATFQSQSPFQQTGPAQLGPSAPSIPNQQQEVQLLYVPYDTLFNQQQGNGGVPPAQNPAAGIHKFNLHHNLPAVNPYQINQFYTPDPIPPQETPYYTTSTTLRPQSTSAKPSNIFQTYTSPQFTTAKPKPKAHQPPLAMFLVKSSSRPSQSDVVSTLSRANTIDVIDAPTKQTPQVFIGPAGMPIPDGYVKFDLPYLSQLSRSRDLREVPFFVAPLSYRTPNGFNKILLPEPHVGSIVVNRAKEKTPENQNTVYQSQNTISQYQESTVRHRPSTQRIKSQNSKEYYTESTQKYRNPFEITTPRTTLQPSRGNKFNYYYDQDALHEVTSPKIVKQERPKKKRPQNVPIEQQAFTQTINNPYAQFKPMPNQILSDEYYKVQTNKPTTSSTSTSTTSTSTTTTTTEFPVTYFGYNTSPQVEFHSTNGHIYPNTQVLSKIPAEEYQPRFTTRPPPTTSAEEEYRMKTYFRQQDAFRNRLQVTSSTNPPFEQIQYTPVALDYEREVTIPSTTHKTTTTPKQRVTYYTPTITPAPPQVETYNSQENDANKNGLSINNRPSSYNQNEILDATVEYEPNPYQLPSELPKLSSNLPGLVNELQEKDKQKLQEETPSPITEAIPEPTKATRRPINRVRKPVISKVTSSVSYSESESSNRRPQTQRVRRPFGTRGSSSTSTTSDDTETSSSTTRRPAASRNPLLRNPNRIRYQPTSEERQSLRLKTRKNGSKKGSDSEDLEYQRDVLKQNYPIFKPSGQRGPTSPTAIPSSYNFASSTEGSTSESQQIYTVTPSNSIDNEQLFPGGLLEPMQIAQQYNEYSKDNYGPGYFPNQEDLTPTEAFTRNEINPVFTALPTTTTTTTTTTTEATPTTTTRRSPFLRRNQLRLRTTTELPTTTTQSTEEKTAVRSRVPPRKVIKVRTRNRRPYHPASSTSAPEEEVEVEPKNNYRKLNRFNQDLYENESPRRRYKKPFQLEGQESQWSPSQDPKDTQNENQHIFENEPEIVTVGPETKKSDTYEFKVSANLGSTDNNSKNSAKGPSLKPEKSFAELLEEVMGKANDEKSLDIETTTRTTDGTYFESQKTTANRPNRRGKWKKVRTSAAANNESFETAESQNLGTQIYNSLYSNDGEEKSTDVKVESKSTTDMTPVQKTESTTTFVTTTPLTTTTATVTTTAAQVPIQTLIEQIMRTTAEPLDMPTATTPTTATTTIPTNASPLDELNMEEIKTTITPLTEHNITEDIATRRQDNDEQINSRDDLDTEPSLFSEVKRQLHELFEIDENDDQAVTAALAAVGRRRQQYTNIKRVKLDTTEATNDVTPTTEATTTTTKKSTTTTTTATESTNANINDETTTKNKFHKDLMKNAVYATSTSTKVTSETEICYRGRCIRSEDLPPNHKLN